MVVAKLAPSTFIANKITICMILQDFIGNPLLLKAMLTVCVLRNLFADYNYVPNNNTFVLRLRGSFLNLVT